MSPRVLDLSDLPDLNGCDLGVSSWFLVTQGQVNGFAADTCDNQWIHTDVERATAEGPFGGTVAHGYLTLSLAPMLYFQLLSVPSAFVLNYGIDRLRFPAPLLVGSSVRLVAVCREVIAVGNGYQLTIGATFERSTGGKPACVADILFRYYPA